MMDRYGDMHQSEFTSVRCVHYRIATGAGHRAGRETQKQDKRAAPEVLSHLFSLGKLLPGRCVRSGTVLRPKRWPDIGHSPD